MRRQRTVLEPAWGKQPAATVALEDERVGTGMQVQPTALLLRRRIGRLGCREIRHVEARPATGGSVPPDVLLSLRPGLAGRVGGGPVVEDAPVARPGPSPLWLDGIVRGAHPATRHVLPCCGKHARVNPDAARRGAFIPEALVVGHVVMVGDGIAV